jgi:hypothetical protein
MANAVQKAEGNIADNVIDRQESATTPGSKSVACNKRS